MIMLMSFLKCYLTLRTKCTISMYIHHISELHAHNMIQIQVCEYSVNTYLVLVVWIASTWFNNMGSIIHYVAYIIIMSSLVIYNNQMIRYYFNSSCSSTDQLPPYAARTSHVVENMSMDPSLWSSGYFHFVRPSFRP